MNRVKSKQNTELRFPPEISPTAGNQRHPKFLAEVAEKLPLMKR